MDVRAIDFKHLWRQLRSVGWASKRPSGGGLEKEWTYTSPVTGHTAPCTEGVRASESIQTLSERQFTSPWPKGTTDQD
ncbi:hypothetical protein PI125_g16056 [Phytophthora idaei]|nr:hypothetical protein PI125_g16056 [Phytophthora idaei]